MGIAVGWWRRGLLDGKHCAERRRGKYFEVYREKAMAALEPGEMIGECECVYRTAFRYAYDAEKAARERRNTFLPRPKKRSSLKTS